MNRLKKVFTPCPCCRNYNVPVGANGFCADCYDYLAEPRTEIVKMWQLLSRINKWMEVAGSQFNTMPDWYSELHELLNGTSYERQEDNENG